MWVLHKEQVLQKLLSLWSKLGTKYSLLITFNSSDFGICDPFFVKCLLVKSQSSKSEGKKGRQLPLNFLYITLLINFKWSRGLSESSRRKEAMTGSCFCAMINDSGVMWPVVMVSILCDSLDREFASGIVESK